MGSSIPEVVQKLNGDPGVRREFATVYGRRPDAGNVLDAITSFERTLVTPGSRFDRWLAGDVAALSAEELNGYRLFKSRRKCRRKPVSTTRHIRSAGVATAGSLARAKFAECRDNAAVFS